jgi:ppGpp synthetase/RelA/SpoT-type nucleotidyltranferase
MKKWWLDTSLPDGALSDPDYVKALDTILRYRRAHENPLRKTTVGMRQFVSRESERVVVAQRLKRLPTIVGKLARQPSMALTRMEDIGGCRAILGTRSEVEGVVGRIQRNWEVVRLRDYVAAPKETGYRAVHVVVSRDGYKVEIQLRTPEQHRWAATVEQTGARLRIELKDGRGPEELVAYFRVAAEMIALKESGEAADEVQARLQALSSLVRPYFETLIEE